MEQPQCPVTGDREVTPWLRVPNRFYPSGPWWQLVRCRSTGLVMLDPRPDEQEIRHHYPAKSYDPFLHESNARSSRDRAYFRLASFLLDRKALFVMHGLAGKPASEVRLLEVGCSTGRLLLRLHYRHEIPAGNLWGVEPDSKSTSVARQAGLPNIVAKLFDPSLDGIRFDRIIFWHSLEHLHRIEASLDRAHDLLLPGGKLVIALPNIDSDDARRYGPNWVAYDAPRHLWHFTPETLRLLLDRHGFSIDHLHGNPADTIYNVWYSEKLERAGKGKAFGIGGLFRAGARTALSLIAGVNPAIGSTILCRAEKRDQPLTSSGTTRPSVRSNSAEATR